MKKEELLKALYRLQEEMIKVVKEENPEEQYPEDVDERIGDIQNVIYILQDIHAEEI